MSNAENLRFNNAIPSSEDLKKRAKKRMPKFAYDYLIEGCFNDVGLDKNRADIQSTALVPKYLQKYEKTDISATLFGKKYDAPFGVAPVGLQGLMWPNAPVILAKAAKKHNIPYILSTVSSESLEVIAEIAEENAWYQLYNPTDSQIRANILDRVKHAGYKNLVVTVDVPTFGYRPRDMRNGLTMPPKKSLTTWLQVCARPEWALKTLRYGVPDFKNLAPYMDNENKLELAAFMNKMAMGSVDLESLKPIRELWQGNLIIKGIMSEADAAMAVELGADGIIVSNHGARQLDYGESSISVVSSIAQKYGDKLNVSMDSGLRSGADLAVGLASGASFGYFGRLFMYAVAALGDEGGSHAMAMLKTQLTQVMSQVRCPDVASMPEFIKPKN